ncbi:hypothetical protein DOH76_08015 [Salmonella enterica subsp. enterica serovar Oranienburg]|uniref:Uncharacterized protein n=1 Tax=Salmonella enterica TaxID=28901 RepID=A0A742KWG5_SALER|nr:hypothetical protein [Salmonella enterica]EBG5024767.1 hypothetical protein [Salmonella enterica subsp. enterica serovar Oranienburg]EAS1264360.1 hypothetical protein [Salmonella enterica]EAT1445989.1 hypothetical protein [Salmonella enterica]EBB1605821.1 hypothetical protein [Salmonella enterica]
MATVLQIVMEEKNGRIETVMKGGLLDKVTQGEIDRALYIGTAVKDALAATGGQISQFDVNMAAAMKRAGRSIN